MNKYTFQEVIKIAQDIEQFPDGGVTLTASKNSILPGKCESLVYCKGNPASIINGICSLLDNFIKNTPENCRAVIVDNIITRMQRALKEKQ